jgi:hypothetical protein
LSRANAFLARIETTTNQNKSVYRWSRLLALDRRGNL